MNACSDEPFRNTRDRHDSNVQLIPPIFFPVTTPRVVSSYGVGTFTQSKYMMPRSGNILINSITTLVISAHLSQRWAVITTYTASDADTGDAM